MQPIIWFTATHCCRAAKQWRGVLVLGVVLAINFGCTLYGLNLFAKRLQLAERPALIEAGGMD